MNKWKPIETAPRDREILVCTEFAMYVARYVYDDPSTGEALWQPDGLPAVYPTHWMPLPKPPRIRR